MNTQRRHILAFLAISVVVIMVGFYLDQTADKVHYYYGNNYSLITLNKGNNEWYYEVHDHGKLLIRQEFIPAVRGHQYFISSEEAEKMGRLVISKLNAQLSPTITINELTENGITFEQ